MPLESAKIHILAAECGFELAGVCAAEPHPDAGRFLDWAGRGLAGRMGYLTDHRAHVRQDPRNLLPSARSIVCVGKVYSGPQPYSTAHSEAELAWIARYAWGEDYHRTLRASLEQLAARIGEQIPLSLRDGFEYRICVDTAPLLERSYARQAGLGWIGRNTCLINEKLGSWVFLGELLTNLDLPWEQPPPDRCGTCTRCIQACPTSAIVPSPGGGWELDARLCISYFTIELRGPIPEEHRTGIGRNVFGCDICQDVCPWNRRAAVGADPAFAARRWEAPPLDSLAALTEQEFRDLFRDTPVDRARYRGFLRNVAVAMGNSGLVQFREPLDRLAGFPDPVVAEHARWALDRLTPIE